MSKADAWMPLYIADYLRDTMHLTRDQHGAYMLLLMACWTRGGRLANDAGQLAGMVKATAAEWRKLAPVILPYFRVDGDQLVNMRVVEEWEKAQRLSEARRETGKKGGRPKKPIGYANGNLEGLQTETPARVASPSPIPPPSEVKDANASSVVVALNDDVRTAFSEWNDLAQRLSLPQAKTLDSGRRASLSARLADGGLPNWRAALVAVERSPLCRGDNDRGWKADLDFVCQLKSWRRLLEGFYGDGTSNLPRTTNGRPGPSQPSAKFDAKQDNYRRALAGAEAASRGRPG